MDNTLHVTCRESNVHSYYPNGITSGWNTRPARTSCSSKGQTSQEQSVKWAARPAKRWARSIWRNHGRNTVVNCPRNCDKLHGTLGHLVHKWSGQLGLSTRAMDLSIWPLYAEVDGSACESRPFVSPAYAVQHVLLLCSTGGRKAQCISSCDMQASLGPAWGPSSADARIVQSGPALVSPRAHPFESRRPARRGRSLSLGHPFFAGIQSWTFAALL